MAGEVPEPGSDALLQWARQASEEFGSNFRTQFCVSWIYDKAGLYKGNKTRRDVATAYNAIWQILEEQFPKRSTWPCWPQQRDLRHGDQHFQDLIHAKPLKKEIIEAMYSLASVEIAAKKGSQTDKPALFAKIYGSPPLQADVTWSKRENKRGLKSPEESWPVREKHIAKSNITDLFQLFRPAAENPSSGSTDTPEAYRFDRSEQVVKFQTKERSLRHTLSGLSWNPGAKRQGIDISNFVAGTWSYVMLQEMNSDDIERLKCLGFSVVSDEESGLAVGMPSDFLKRPGQKVADLTETLPSGQWALRAIFVRFDLKVADNWPLQHLVLASAHLNNDVANKKRGITRELLQKVFRMAMEVQCDILGADWNQGVSQLAEQFKEFIEKNELTPVPPELLALREGDCCGFLVLPDSQLLNLKLLRHGSITFDHRDMQIRQYDTDSHHPCFCFHSISNQRDRNIEMSEARLKRKERKEDKLQWKRAKKGWEL